MPEYKCTNETLLIICLVYQLKYYITREMCRTKIKHHMQIITPNRCIFVEHPIYMYTYLIHLDVVNILYC